MRKRFFRKFSLRLLICIVIACSVIFGVWTNRANRQKRAIQWIVENGGQYDYAYELDALWRGETPESPLPDWIETRIDVNFVYSVKGVYFQQPTIEDIGPLKDLPGISDLIISGDVTQINELSNSDHLERLSISGTKIRDLKPLANIQQLVWLLASDCPVEDLRPLSKLEKLERLDLSRTNVTDTWPLTGLDSLESLNLDFTRVENVEPLAKLKGLKRLRLQETIVNDVRPLAKCSQLKLLNLMSTPVDPDDVKWLRNQLPGCDILYAGQYKKRYVKGQAK